MSPTRPLAKLPIDPYLLALIATVATAVILPSRGAGARVVDTVVYLAVAMPFLLYGARLSLRTVMKGLADWRLQSTMLASTFVLFPAVGLLLSTLFNRILTPSCSWA